MLIADVADPRTLSTGTTQVQMALAVDSTGSDCVQTQGEDARCYVTYNETSGGQPTDWDSHGMPNPVFGSEVKHSPFASLSDVYPIGGNLVVAAGIATSDGCGALEASGSEWSGTTCDRVYGTFSPNGEQITLTGDDPDRSPYSGTDNMTDRLGVMRLGKPGIGWFRAPAQGQTTLVGSIQWANETDVVAKVWQDDAWSLVRFDASGRATEVAPPKPGGVDQQMYALETQP